MRFARLAAASAAMTMVVGGFAASAGFAQGNPHFRPGDPQYSIVGNNAVNASGKIVGIGDSDIATITLSATASVQCTNKGGHSPKPFQKTVSSTESFSSDRNGSISFDLTTPAVTAKCPGKMAPVVTFSSATVSVDVDGVTFSDTHNF
jgi:hypothetical protein